MALPCKIIEEEFAQRIAIHIRLVKTKAKSIAASDFPVNKLTGGAFCKKSLRGAKSSRLAQAFRSNKNGQIKVIYGIIPRF